MKPEEWGIKEFKHENELLLAVLTEAACCYAIPSGPHCGNIVTGKRRADCGNTILETLRRRGIKL